MPSDPLKDIGDKLLTTTKTHFAMALFGAVAAGFALRSRIDPLDIADVVRDKLKANFPSVIDEAEIIHAAIDALAACNSFQSCLGNVDPPEGDLQ